MPQKEHGNNPKKQISVSQEENALVQQQLTDYLKTAAALKRSSNPGQAEEALTPITSLSESAQIALLKALSKENTTEAANVLLAVNTFAPLKETRKEARRSLIRLEEARYYPQWTPPQPPAPAAAIEEATSTGPMRFWKGQYTDSRATGEIQLMLFWEQGENFKEVRTFGFLLEFWHDGVKDFFTEVSSKRQIERRMENLRAQLGGIKLVECNFAEGRGLVEEALAVNKKSGTKPHSDYTRNLPLIRKLLLDAADNSPEDDTSSSNQERALPFDEARDLFDQLMELGLDPEEQVAFFLDSWLKGDYETAYSALASDSPIREGLELEEWVARRSAWAEQVHPSQGKSEITYKRGEAEEEEEENVVSAVSKEKTTNEPEVVEAFWSLILTDAEASKDLKELPHATAVYKATGRHWFWTKYTLVREENEWRIHSMIDAGSEALQLPPEELQRQLTEIAELAAEQLNLVEAEVEDEEDEDEEDLEEETDEDEEDEDEEDLEEDLEDLEFEELAERFPEQRGEALRKLAIAQINIARSYEANDDEDRALNFIAEAEKTLRDSIAIDSAPMGNILLAETLLAQNKELDEAERLLQEVLQQENIDAKETTLAEAGLGKLAQDRSEHENALSHYQRAAEISPDFPGIWFNVGFMQRQLGRLEEAEQNYQRSIDESPTETGAYAELAALYSDRGEFDEAEATLEEGLEINPEAVDLLAAMALLFINKGDLKQAKEYLDEAEDIDEEHELVQVVHQYYEAKRTEQKQERQQFKQKHKSRKPKRK